MQEKLPAAGLAAPDRAKKLSVTTVRIQSTTFRLLATVFEARTIRTSKKPLACPVKSN